MSDETTPLSEREELEALVAWRAAGVLSRADAARLDAALAEDPALAAELAAAHDELAETIAANEALGAPSRRAMDNLFAAIDAEPARRAPLDLAGAITGFFAALSPRALAWATAAVALVIVAQAAVIGSGILASAGKPQPGGPGYNIASGPNQPPAATGAVVLVSFRPSATAADVTAFLAAHKAAIVDGPDPGGLYRVRVAPAPLPDDKLAAITAEMQKSPVVAMVLPAS